MLLQEIQKANIQKGVEKVTERESKQGKKTFNTTNHSDPTYASMKISCI